MPPPEDVKSLLCSVARRVVRLLKRFGRLDEGAYPQDALQVLQAASILPRPPALHQALYSPYAPKECGEVGGWPDLWLHGSFLTHTTS